MDFAQRKRLRKKRSLCYVVYFAVVALILVGVPIIKVSALPDTIWLSQQEIEKGINISGDTPFVSETADLSSDVGLFDSNGQISIKLFGIFDLKKTKVQALPVSSLIAAGNTIGFEGNTYGPIVVSSQHDQLKAGDIITKVDNALVQTSKQFSTLATSGEKTLQIIRDGKEKQINVDLSSKLGIWLKDNSSGVGTLTYVQEQTNNYAALGHAVTDSDTKKNIKLTGGNVFVPFVMGTTKSSNGKIGHINANFDNSQIKQQGSITKSDSAGVYGCINSDSALLDKVAGEYQVASRYSMKPGNAKMLTSLNGGPPEQYDIKILKTYNQKKKGTKSFIVKITDQRILRNTGGIVHGMSGSPIIQDGKFVGALTHVMLSDCTKGYGIYIDWMVKDL